MKHTVIGIVVALIVALLIPATTHADDQRLCYGPGQVRTAVYANAFGGIDVYIVSDADAGLKKFTVTDATLADLPTDNDRAIVVNSTLAEDNGVIDVVLYRLTSGEYQINAGPNQDKEVFVCIFDAMPPAPGSTRIETFKID